jgi:hypothetical protein
VYPRVDLLGSPMNADGRVAEIARVRKARQPSEY